MLKERCYILTVKGVNNYESEVVENSFALVKNLECVRLLVQVKFHCSILEEERSYFANLQIQFTQKIVSSKFGAHLRSSLAQLSYVTFGLLLFSILLVVLKERMIFTEESCLHIVNHLFNDNRTVVVWFMFSWDEVS